VIAPLRLTSRTLERIQGLVQPTSDATVLVSEAENRADAVRRGN
jgi:hypothetical protein